MVLSNINLTLYCNESAMSIKVSLDSLFPQLCQKEKQFPPFSPKSVNKLKKEAIWDQISIRQR